MTAFARQEQQTEQGNLIWEIRSVNHRYSELSLRLDERFRVLEMPIRKLFSEQLGRGKVDAVLRYKAPENQSTNLDIDQTLAQSVVKQCELISGFADQAAPINPVRILQWPGVIKAESLDQVALNASVMSALLLAVNELIVSRETEGAALHKMVEQRCNDIDAIAKAIRERMPTILAEHQQRLKDRVAELAVDLDPERLEQEMVLLAQKNDVAEELDRLESHVVEVRCVLQRDEPVGRRLDFLMQELNREANTLGSKSINSETTNHSVELKVLIEQMREQIQNIE
ncbi:MAG: YicC family protein [Gammaproteobacteria bacterium]|nr:YicC family protein [Gammaproteobacteria bacterium]